MGNIKYKTQLNVNAKLYNLYMQQDFIIARGFFGI